MSEKLIFQSSIEALFHKALVGQVSDALKADLRGLGLDLDKPLPPAIGRDVWYEALERTARSLFVGVPREQAMWRLGSTLFKGLEDSLLGKALAPVARTLGPARLLKRVPHNIKSANNFAQSRYDELGPGEGLLWVSDVGTSPEFTAGTLDAMVRWAGAVDCVVAIERLDALACNFKLRWSRDG